MDPESKLHLRLRLVYDVPMQRANVQTSKALLDTRGGFL